MRTDHVAIKVVLSLQDTTPNPHTSQQTNQTVARAPRLETAKPKPDKSRSQLESCKQQLNSILAFCDPRQRLQAPDISDHDTDHF